MSDKNFFKSLVQEQIVELENPDFTNKVLRKIKVREKQQKIFRQLLLGYILCGIMTGIYLLLQPYINQMIITITTFWNSNSFDILWSLPLLITYALIGFLSLFFYCESQDSTPFNL